MKKVVFAGSGVAIVTPMNSDFSINYDVLGQLIEFQIKNGTDAIIICGTTGEASTLTDDEHIAAIDFTVKKVAGRIPVVAGVGSNDTEYALFLTRQAKAVGADALMHVTPYYNKTTQLGLIKHFQMMADATDLPIILYNVPSRTGMDIKPDTYLELSKHPNIVAIKEAGGNMAAVARTFALCGDELTIYSGNDDQVVPIMSLGGKGVISVLGNIMPREIHDLAALYLAGKVRESAKLQINLMSIIDAMFIEVNPVPVKAALNLMGYNAGPPRMPLLEISESAKKTLVKELEKFKLV